MATNKTVVRYRSAPKRKHRSKAKATIPLAVLAGFVPIARDIVQGYTASGIQGAGHYLVGGLTGYDSNTHKWNLPWAVNHFYLPVGAGFLVHTLASRLGVNRALGRAGVPLLRI